MALPNNFQGDLQVNGNLSASTFTYPTGSIFDAHVSTTAAIAASKVCHRMALRTHQSGTAAAATIPLHAGYAGGTLIRVAVSAIVAPIGAATVTVDVKKNGTTVLTTPIVLDNTTAARTQKFGTLATGPTYAAADYFEAVITVAAGGGTLPTGLLVEVFVDENPQ